MRQCFPDSASLHPGYAASSDIGFIRVRPHPLRMRFARKNFRLSGAAAGSARFLGTFDTKSSVGNDLETLFRDFCTAFVTYAVVPGFDSLQRSVDLGNDVLGVFAQRIQHIVIFTLSRLLSEVFFDGLIFVVNISIDSTDLPVVLVSEGEKFLFELFL